MWRWLLEQDGLLNYVLVTLGILQKPIPWLGNRRCPVRRDVRHAVEGPRYYMVIYLAGLQGISPELEEAAITDGVPLAGLRWVTLPLLRRRCCSRRRSPPSPPQGFRKRST
jgi:putative chitobiose transport system permease protein